MYSVRKVKTKSGATAIQVVQYIGHRCKIFKHIGSSINTTVIEQLKQAAQNWISSTTYQTSLFPEEKQKVLVIESGECISVTRKFSYLFFISCLTECGLSKLPMLLQDLVIIRLIEPASKQRSIKLLSHYFDIHYSQRFYREIPKFILQKPVIEQCAYKVAMEKFKEPFYFVLYDVTTLYFETFNIDELKIQGFSKDNKSLQPQIVIGLLVTQSGFPLTYEVFSGNTFEGKTMLPIVEDFISKHPQSKPIIVADAAMLDEERLTELREKKISYIVGARLANASKKLIKQINDAVSMKDGAISRFSSKHGYLICDFSLKRFKKETNDLNKLVQKAQELVARQNSGTKAKFIKRVTKEKIELNIDLIEKRKLLLGIKGYCTDLSESKLPNDQIINRYHQLWHIEQSFRMSKFDLQARPIYHRNEDAIRSHVLICFASLIIEKYLELTTKLSLRDIRFLVWNITETHIQDKRSKAIFTFRSPVTEIMQSNIAPLIKMWNLLSPH